MFTATLFTIAKICKQLKCPSTNDWVKDVIYVYSGILAIKMNEILPLAATWMDLKNIMFREISQTLKGKYSMLSLLCVI